MYYYISIKNNNNNPQLLIGATIREITKSLDPVLLAHPQGAKRGKINAPRIAREGGLVVRALKYSSSTPGQSPRNLHFCLTPGLDPK